MRNLLSLWRASLTQLPPVSDAVVTTKTRPLPRVLLSCLLRVLRIYQNGDRPEFEGMQACKPRGETPFGGQEGSNKEQTEERQEGETRDQCFYFYVFTTQVTSL